MQQRDLRAWTDEAAGDPQPAGPRGRVLGLNRVITKGVLIARIPVQSLFFTISMAFRKGQMTGSPLLCTVDIQGSQYCPAELMSGLKTSGPVQPPKAGRGVDAHFTPPLGGRSGPIGRVPGGGPRGNTEVAGGRPLPISEGDREQLQVLELGEGRGQSHSSLFEKTSQEVSTVV